METFIKIGNDDKPEAVRSSRRIFPSPRLRTLLHRVQVYRFSFVADFLSFPDESCSRLERISFARKASNPRTSILLCIPLIYSLSYCAPELKPTSAVPKKWLSSLFLRLPGLVPARSRRSLYKFHQSFEPYIFSLSSRFARHVLLKYDNFTSHGLRPLLSSFFPSFSYGFPGTQTRGFSFPLFHAILETPSSFFFFVVREKKLPAWKWILLGVTRSEFTSILNAFINGKKIDLRTRPVGSFKNPIVLLYDREGKLPGGLKSTYSESDYPRYQ